MESVTPEAVAVAAQHAARGAGASLAALLALANAVGNRKAVTHALRSLDASGLRLRGPSRSLAAVAVFVGSFRFVQRLIAYKKTRGAAAAASLDAKAKGVVPASVLASVLATLCLPPKNRPAVVSLLSTNALSLLFRDAIARNPQLSALAPLELAVFMAACGWIYYSGFFHPDSYEKSHMNLLLKYTLLEREAANRLQGQYALGQNSAACSIRHPGRSCRQFYTETDFFKRVVELGLRVYLPVHLTSWVVGMRSPKTRRKPPLELAATFVARLSRSVAYFFGFVGVGWAFSCLVAPLGDRSISMRKLQFFVSGALPSAALLFELPSRRRPIGVILTSYVLVSVASVALEHVSWLQRGGGGSGAARTAIEASAVAAAVAYTISGSLGSSRLLRRVLLAQSLAKRRKVAANDATDLGDQQ